MPCITETLIHETGTNGKIVVEDCCSSCISVVVEIHREDHSMKMQIARSEATALRDALNKYLIVN